MISFLRNKSAIGIDLGSSFFKAVETDKSGKRLFKALSLPAPDKAVVQGGLGDTGRAFPVLEKLVIDGGWRGRKAVAAAAGRQVLTRQIRMPVMPENELPEAVQWEAEKYLPAGNNEMVIDFLNQGEIDTEDGRQFAILLAGIPRKTAEEYYQLFKRAGLQLMALDLVSLALGRLLKSCDIGDALSLAVVEIGAQQTEMNVFHDHRLTFNRTINFGGQKILESLEQTYNLSEEEAAAALEQGAMPQSVGGMRDEVLAREEITLQLSSILEGLVREIKRSLDFQRTQVQGSAVEKIFLSGGTARFSYLEEFLAQELEIPVTKLQPRRFLQDLEIGFSVAAGLALRGKKL